ncbi:hypothetical protein A0128_13050 [Leptospira tipperaryensis]|uniref:Uncharacterized protein n=1 Tax=Leptospira tipperaryensis TaxID=2564040 RepID=A0A1D7UYP1_9LEPT|nr:hypothetical protein [Leptospira tipperaryensis]AOP34697.1 hypothetical protein A0128_13050 [Leptospira tipperaryensis]
MHLFPSYVLEKHLRMLWIGSVFLGFFFCKPSPHSMGNNPYAELFSNHKITRVERYTLYKGWENRVFSLDPDEQNFIQEMNRIDGFQDSPEPDSNLSLWKNRLRAVRKNLPDSVNSILDDSLYRVILCKNLGGTGLTGFVYDSHGPAGGVIFLDTEMLTQTANEWITKKENSPFRSPNTQIAVQIESELGDSIESATEYILLHEVGHLVSVREKIVPDFREIKRDFSTFEFSNGIWSSELESSFDSRFPLRKKVRFYTNDPMDLETHWNEIYPVLKTTPFPTLYSANNGDDFFADSFVSYVHTELQKKVWRLEILQNKKKVFEMKNGIQEERCLKQKKFLDGLFQKKR